MEFDINVSHSQVMLKRYCCVTNNGSIPSVRNVLKYKQTEIYKVMSIRVTGIVVCQQANIDWNKRPERNISVISTGFSHSMCQIRCLFCVVDVVTKDFSKPDSLCSVWLIVTSLWRGAFLFSQKKIQPAETYLSAVRCPFFNISPPALYISRPPSPSATWRRAMPG